MVGNRRRGFTLIELLLVIVIIGILAAIAIPKFAATKDKAKLASVRSDLRNIMTAQEAYYIDWALYTGSLSSQTFTPSSGNSLNMSGTTQSFTATVTNASITTNPKQCTVTVGAGTSTDGQITCS
ncbi:MAG: prepilin-type N-terminal cleavage/methylation domain-containing protein [Gemmatimonadetes bacterium]|nr:prepilin-type N-terminal cleavage/methylation domain-containing protein [Gemmatimonadota bacterium]MCB9504796.1 prepilin-type N-terminal cleavage/methylation domain-containing protein [Gemmatimonadales bacterium]MCA9762503.1 prepilin-type N-terminal cleavage/methylation domain-containing protein [Gemmatimonadota bacterium]MCB9518810.1 prepilin-type N-terminal cleavage/methylation domain-containing protein [Gemmatimonadales bacterium]HPF62455.1 prepilin-type N-terminal cleavage/methylation do